MKGFNLRFGWGNFDVLPASAVFVTFGGLASVRQDLRFGILVSGFDDTDLWAVGASASLGVVQSYWGELLCYVF
jgi:hypothetical protein